jgi:hypothetical protein
MFYDNILVVCVFNDDFYNKAMSSNDEEPK